MSPSTTADLPGHGRGNFVRWIDGSDLYNARQLEILDIVVENKCILYQNTRALIVPSVITLLN